MIRILFSARQLIFLTVYQMQALDNIKYIVILLNLISFFAFLATAYAKKPKKVHYMSLTWLVSYLICILFYLFYAVFFITRNRYLYVLLCIIFIINPFIIGAFGNDYEKKTVYSRIQLLFYIASIAFFTFVI